MEFLCGLQNEAQCNEESEVSCKIHGLILCDVLEAGVGAIGWGDSDEYQISLKKNSEVKLHNGETVAHRILYLFFVYFV